jgi:hypothetical protein
MVTRFVTSLPTDNCPQPKETLPAVSTLTPDQYNILTSRLCGLMVRKWSTVPISSSYTTPSTVPISLSFTTPSTETHLTHGICHAFGTHYEVKPLQSRTHRRTANANQPTTNGRAGNHCTDNRNDRWTAYTGDLSILQYTAPFPVVRTHARTHARTYRYTAVHHYRYTRVHHFRYEHVDESTPIAPR